MLWAVWHLLNTRLRNKPDPLAENEANAYDKILSFPCVPDCVFDETKIMKYLETGCRKRNSGNFRQLGLNSDN